MQKNENPAVAMKKRRTFSKINALAIQHYENTEYRQIALYSLNAEIELDFFFSQSQTHIRDFRTTKVLNVQA